MKKKTIVEKCEIIYNTIDGLANQYRPIYVESSRECGQIRGFIFDIVEEEKIFKSLFGEGFEEEEKEHDYNDFIAMLSEISFGLGFTVGQLFDTPYKPVKDDIKILGELLREKKLLPLFPREKRVA